MTNQGPEQPMKVGPNRDSDSFVSVWRDDSDVFVDSLSAIVFAVGGWARGDEHEFDVGPGIVRIKGGLYSETELALPLHAARAIRDEITRLLND